MRGSPDCGAPGCREFRGSNLSTGFSAVHFPASALRILDYNRLVRDLNGLEPAGLLRRIEAADSIS
jgi:hypothetical protein